MKKDFDGKSKGGRTDHVVVFETDKPFEAEIVKGLLEQFGINAFVITSGRERDLMYPITKLFEQEPQKHYHIYVDSNDKEEAEAIIASADKPIDDAEDDKTGC
jgi:hypothetical protein